MKEQKITRQDAVRAYRLLIKEGKPSPEEQNHFIRVFNCLILHRWSMAGLRWIKNQAWNTP